MESSCTCHCVREHFAACRSGLKEDKANNCRCVTGQLRTTATTLCLHNVHYYSCSMAIAGGGDVSLDLQYRGGDASWSSSVDADAAAAAENRTALHWLSTTISWELAVILAIASILFCLTAATAYMVRSEIKESICQSN